MRMHVTLIARFRRACVAAGLLLAASAAQSALTEMGDSEMSEVNGQALFVVDKIPGNLTGSDALSTPFTYYRLGVDADMYLNLNVDKLQLGCGGFNEGIAAGACDMDADFISLSGGSGPTSDFIMRRPYMELAIKNDGDKTRREIVGVKIGAEAAEGVMSIGRVYNNGNTNLEWGGTCNHAYADNVDNGSRLACHSGANRISGFMQAEMSGRGFVDSTIDSWACFGYVRNTPGSVCNNPARAEFVALAGTRMQEIAARNMTLYLDPPITVLFVTLSDGYADIRENLRMLHNIVMGPSNKDFYLSFQRERLRWPIYNYNSPYDTDGFFPIGNSKNGDTTSRAYHYPANTGWWMNIQNAEVLDADAGTINLSFIELANALFEGANLYNFNTGQIPKDNCFGTQVFC